jgi:hypothetical protein
VCGYGLGGGAFSFEQLISFESKVGCSGNKRSSNVHNTPSTECFADLGKLNMLIVVQF